MATAKKLPSGKYRCRASYTDEFGKQNKKKEERTVSKFFHRC